ncbi:hypothetical protein GALMADRAFT_211384 [Galerina marginata CBS 339.88]|uniref:Smr domain-containing protein n=1 Tax=Galerina marginata (strain CBS 339.88) TaxID=685588 RepID=A0A067SVW6_GALM3|nr:hypothetical protein GALMADRAFT_211384 [Galerina marginata CBS 339.88]
MDVALSILAGLGLRLFLVFTTGSSPSSKLTTAVLGLWEGIVLHQLSGRSTSPNLDHFLAYGLRLAVDLLVSKSLQRMVMVVLWSALGTVTSEAVVPHASLRAALKKERERQRERRHRHSRSVPGAVPILSTPLPPRIRAYKAPGPDQAQSSITLLLPLSPPPQSSTPIHPTDRPPTPPSFFLQDSSPSPKPVHLQIHGPVESSAQDALPVRPRSGLATVLDHSPDSGSPPPLPIHLPTPPDSAQSAVPSDVNSNETYHENHIPRFDNQLYTIPELSSPEDNVTPPDTVTQPSNNGHVADNLHQGITALLVQTTETNNAPLPVPNPGIRHLHGSSVAEWLTSQSTNVKPEPESIFPNPFATTSDAPLPLPVRIRHQEPLWQIETPSDTNHGFKPAALEERIHGNGHFEDDHHSEDSDSDELRTPGTRNILNMETDHELDADPLLTPTQLRNDQAEEVLSPLSLNVRSTLDHDEFRVSDPGPPSATSSQDTHPAPDVIEDNDYLQIPGSLSQNPLLQPPLPPSGPLFRASSSPPESPPPPSPSTILSDPSDVSILSTRIPNTLYRRADELRQKAREEEVLRGKLEEKRRQAEADGRTMEALQLKIKVREMDAEAFKLHEKAARRFFTARNPLAKSSEIDVHGLRPREAFDRIERAIVKASEEKRTTVRVIVGKGLHSVNQKPTLKPTVQREMQRYVILLSSIGVPLTDAW